MPYPCPIQDVRPAFRPTLGQKMGKNPRKSTPGTQIVPNVHHIPTKTPQEYARKTFLKTHFFQNGHLGRSYNDRFEKSVFLKMFSWHVLKVFGWVSGGYLELSGFPECFFGGFCPFFGPEWV